jgi:hypothetical protein
MGVFMNRKFILSNSLWAAALLLASVAMTAQAAKKTDQLITVLNPAIETRLADRVPLAPRLDTLDGKTIYLVDTDWEGLGQNTTVLEEMQQWFAKHMPGVKTIIKLKKGGYMTDDPGLWKEIADNGGDGVIIGVAG